MPQAVVEDIRLGQETEFSFGALHSLDLSSTWGMQPSSLPALIAVKQLPPSTPDLDAIHGQVKMFLPSHNFLESGRNLLKKQHHCGPSSDFGLSPPSALFFGAGHPVGYSLNCPFLDFFFKAWAESFGLESWRSIKHSKYWELKSHLSFF